MTAPQVMIRAADEGSRNKTSPAEGLEGWALRQEADTASEQAQPPQRKICRTRTNGQRTCATTF